MSESLQVSPPVGAGTPSDRVGRPRIASDLQLDLDSLRELMRIASETLNEMDFNTDAGRNSQLDRIATLVRIAEEIAAQAVADFDVSYHSLGRRS